LDLNSLAIDILLSKLPEDLKTKIILKSDKLKEEDLMNILSKNKTLEFEDSDLVKVKISGKDLPITKNLKITNVKEKIKGNILLDKLKDANNDDEYLSYNDNNLSDLDHLLNQDDNINFDKVLDKKELLNQRLKNRNQINSNFHGSTKKSKLYNNVVNLKKQEQALKNLRDNLKNKIILRDSNQLNSDLLNSEMGLNGPLPIGIPSALPFKNIKIPINDNVFKSDENINIIANKVSNLQNNPLLVKPSVTLIKTIPINHLDSTVQKDNILKGNSTNFQNDTINAILKQQNNQQINIQNQQNMLINLSNKISDIPKMLNLSSSVSNNTNLNQSIIDNMKYKDSDNTTKNISNITRKIPFRLSENQIKKDLIEGDDEDNSDKFNSDINFIKIKEEKLKNSNNFNKLNLSKKSNFVKMNNKENLRLKNKHRFYSKNKTQKIDIMNASYSNSNLIQNLKKGLFDLDDQVNAIKKTYLKK
jgi:hypothetical protein